MTIKQQGGIFGRNPTFNTAEIDGDLTVGSGVLHVDASSSEVGINIVNPTSEFHVHSTGNSDLRLTNDSTGSGLTDGLTITMATNSFAYINNRESGKIRFQSGSNYFDLDTSGNIAFPSGQGIDFSATSGTGTSELFDDYEEGTFTASFKVGGTTLYSTTTTRYTKVGRIVYYNIDFTNNSYPGVGANTGNVTVSGLPYAATNTVGRAVVSNILQVSNPFTANLQDIGTNINATSNEITFYSTTGTTSNTLTNTALSASSSSSTYLRLSGVYTAA